jgi:hypothetical protein
MFSNHVLSLLTANCTFSHSICVCIRHNGVTLTPFCSLVVIIGWILGKPLKFLFDSFESVVFSLSCEALYWLLLKYNPDDHWWHFWLDLSAIYIIRQDGKSNWAKGLGSICMYKLLGPLLASITDKYISPLYINWSHMLVQLSATWHHTGRLSLKLQMIPDLGQCNRCLGMVRPSYQSKSCNWAQVMYFGVKLCFVVQSHMWLHRVWVVLFQTHAFYCFVSYDHTWVVASSTYPSLVYSLLLLRTDSP